MKKIAFCLGLLCTIFVRADLNPGRPEAQPNRTLSTLESSIRTIYDFIGVERLGYHAVSKENEQFIRALITELNMDDYCIEIRGMTYQAKLHVGYINAFVIPTLFSKKKHAYLYISEVWFDTLSNEEKRALVGHELMHIYLNHRTKSFLLSISSAIVAGAMGNMLAKVIIEKNSTVANNSAFPTIMSALEFTGSMLVQSKYSRMCEKEADIKATQVTHEKQGMLTLLHTMKTKTHDPKSKFIIKRIKDKMIKPIAHLFSSHPKISQRVAYIKKLELN